MPFLIAALATVALLAPERAQEPDAVLRSIQIVAEAGLTRVVIDADGPLPLPTIGVLDDPPRIYLDLRDVAPVKEGIVAEANGLVRRVRIAMHEEPVRTRVVLDLAQPAPHELDARERARGRLVVIAGSRAHAGSSASKGPATVAVAPSAERESAEIADARTSLERLRSLLSAIDRREDVPEAQLRAGIEEFDRIRESLATSRASRGRASIHENLTKVCTLGVTAARGRIDAQSRADAGVAWNAASAAAGALILLDRAALDQRPPTGSK